MFKKLEPGPGSLIAELDNVPTLYVTVYKLREDEDRKEQMTTSEEEANQFAESLITIFKDKLELVMVAKMKPVILSAWADEETIGT